MSDIHTFDAISATDTDVVGGKGLSLALMTAAGLPVPPGFCITSDAYRRFRCTSPQNDATFLQEVVEAYRQLGGGAVAVRSSATAEDGAVTSFAGQQESILGVSQEAAVADAVKRCWASLDSERAIAYRRKQGIDDSSLAMAVVVQRLVPAEVSGVLFTRDPLDPDGQRMLVEASWGLGESVVSGRVTPDRFHLDRETGAVLDRCVSTKATLMTAAGPQEVPPEKQSQPCLEDSRLAELAELGRWVEAFYGDARDIEWAWAEGRFWLLQARPITTAGAAEREQVRREEIAALTSKAAPGGTVWSRFNLAEVLPEPTPMTWAVVRRLISGSGGFGLMYRDLGFEPDPALDEEGVYDLICGRPYCNLSREPGMYANGIPLEHSFAVLRAAPAKALYPRAEPNWSRAGWRFWLFLPTMLVRSMRLAMSLQRTLQTFDKRFRNETIPAFAAECEGELSRDLAQVDSRFLLERLEYWIRRSLCDFARDGLKPTVLAAWLMTNIEQGLAKKLGTAGSRTALGELTLGVRPDPASDLASAVRDLTQGRLERATFLQHFGHRGPHEMELSQPRWAEDHTALDRLTPAGEAMRVAQSAQAAIRAEDLDTGLRTRLERLHCYLGLRETAKHYLMTGYALIRRILVELDRRHNLNGGIFHLTPEELPRLIATEDLSALITERRRRRAIALSLEVPQVLFSDDLEAIGRPITMSDADTLQGVPLSAGVAEGPALVLRDPTTDKIPSERYILVCPTTDPAWVPLFVHARGLVMETGGVLSHGAIVAREFGLPAVAGLPGILLRVRNGQRVRVDGATGTVCLLKGDPAMCTAG